MGQEKEYLTKLAAFVKACYEELNDDDFAAEIKAIVMDDIKDDIQNGKIYEIYELFIHKNLLQQANSVYSSFAIPSIKDKLISRYIKMEKARRENDFDDFGLRAYQQIELIVNTLAADEEVAYVVEKMLRVPYLTRSERVDDRVSSKSDGSESQHIGNFVLINSTSAGKSKAQKMSIPLQEQYATDKVRLIVFFICFKGMIRSGKINNPNSRRQEYYKDYDEWTHYTQICSDIYTVRNRVHSGKEPSEYEVARYEELTTNPEQTYLSFLSFLYFFIQGVNNGYPISQELYDFAVDQQAE